MNTATRSFEISFTRLFEQQLHDLAVRSIEIPLIQRDYAQGRPGEAVANIRKKFIDALYCAVLPGGSSLNLDFVYGDVEKETLYPLDGQQRLTTLFLLHWYLAWRSDVPIVDQPWTKFTYATRPGARTFCERLVQYRPKTGEIAGDKKLSDWLKDQEWYLYTWKYDPTIRSTLVMLDALHERFCRESNEDCAVAWFRLTDAQQPAIRFHLLPIPSNGETDESYIKMNSRGKPLTAFENFKANFEATLKIEHPEKADYFANKVDTDWTDTLWHYRGSDNLIDDEFICYFRFVTELCTWQSGVQFDEISHFDQLAEWVYGKSDAKAEHLEFLFKAFDIWHKKDIKAEFDGIFARAGRTGDQLLLFNAFHDVHAGESPIDLLAWCCRLYGNPKWTLAHTLLLFAVLLNRIHNTTDFSRQLRILRNLIEASIGSEIRSKNMCGLLADVKRIVVGNTLAGVTTFNESQVRNENDKAALLQKHPGLLATVHRLEDHDLLRGCLTAFDLDPHIDPNTFVRRADTFHALFDNSHCWPELTGALLAIGDYSHRQDRWMGYHLSDFGVSQDTHPWQYMFMGNRGKELVGVFENLLDQVVAARNNLAVLKTIQQNFLQQCTTCKSLEWRYYFVKYPVMRDGASGRYAIREPGYSACMLEKWVMRSNYRDPYLFAIWKESDVGGAIQEPPWPWFFGYETESRHMTLKSSGVKIQCVDQGWQLSEEPTEPTQKATFEKVCSKYGIGQDRLYTVPQDNGIDTSDRIIMGAKLLQDLVDSGL